jgi:curved DNA-binding protein
MIFIDYYKILGINKTATFGDIINVYRRLARKYHPGLNPYDKDAKKKFQEINEANEVLSDPEKRKKYYQYGKDWQHADEFEKALHY